MTGLRIAPIVEGHGEVNSVRLLLERTWYGLLSGGSLEILQPIRPPRYRVVRPDELHRAVCLAKLKLRQKRDNDAETDTRECVLLLVDADEDLPCRLAPQLVAAMRDAEPDVDFVCVLANPEYETWFVGAAESLGEHLALRANEVIPDAPESTGSKKAWIAERFPGPYSPTVDQPRLTAAMDLTLCRRRCPSLDKLCRELERRLTS